MEFYWCSWFLEFVGIFAYKNVVCFQGLSYFIMEDFIFYGWHRLLHTKWLYKHGIVFIMSVRSSPLTPISDKEKKKTPVDCTGMNVSLLPKCETRLIVLWYTPSFDTFILQCHCVATWVEDALTFVDLFMLYWNHWVSYCNEVKEKYQSNVRGKWNRKQITKAP